MAQNPPARHRLNRGRISDELRRAESQLRYIEAQALPSGLPGEPGRRSLPEMELKKSASVDRACVVLAEDLARRLHPMHRQHPVATIDPSLLSMVVARLTDAQRFLREHPALPKDWPDEPEGLLRALLYERWHSYAEPYWLGRREACRDGGFSTKA